MSAEPTPRSRAEVGPEVIEAARSNRSAFGLIYDHYLARVYAFCWLYSTSRQEAEDLTAQTFERALLAIDRYQDRGAPFSAWLLRIAGNAARDRGRRQQRELSAGALATAPPDIETIDEWLPEWEDAFWLREHVRALPPDQQEVVRLRYYEDHSFVEVAARMGRSEGAVKQLLRRALKSLLALLEQEAGVADVR